MAPIPTNRFRFASLSILIAILACGFFVPGMGGGFMLDDAPTIVENPVVHVDQIGENALLNAATGYFAGQGTRPLPMVTFALDYWRQGQLNSAAFKATNLLIHALTACFLALLLRRLLCLAKWSPRRAEMAALLLAFAWAIHPLQVSAVLYIVQRMQTMASLFIILALWAYLGLRQAQLEDRRGWPHGLLAGIFWLLALASKEDAVLLPLYCLLLEVTILRFRAAQPWRTHGLLRTYTIIALAGATLFVFWVLPHYWSWEPYGRRNFNSLERLLTEARVLVVYLGQIVFPLPSQMPFNYDSFTVSRGLLTPRTTLPSILLLAGLLGWAWRWRDRRPVFAFGVLFFFAGHFLTSNVIGLELAFEHRNHLPLLGILLACGDLLITALDRWPARRYQIATLTVALIASVGFEGITRAYIWGDPVRRNEYHVRITPDSPRAWLALGEAWFNRAGRADGRTTPELARAIEVIAEGARQTGSPSAYSNVVVYKTIQGTVSQADWDRLLQRLTVAPMGEATKNIVWTTMANVRANIGLNEREAVNVIDAITTRASFTPTEQLRIGVFIYTKTPAQDRALPYFLRAAARLPPGDPNIAGLATDLRTQGRGKWALAVEQASAAGKNERDRHLETL